jgi:hypothetical protein
MAFEADFGRVLFFAANCLFSLPAFNNKAYNHTLKCFEIQAKARIKARKERL